MTKSDEPKLAPMAGIERCSARHELCDATMEEALMDLTTL
jgi:hypothetical protein